MRRSAIFTATVIAAVVFGGSTPAQAADSDSIKRAIVITVLTNLGVDPTPSLVNQIVRDLPIDALDSVLVEQVGDSLDNSDDPALIIGQTVDSDGDGIPNADATTEDDENEADDEDDSSSGSSTASNGTSGSNTGGTSTKPSTPSDDNDDSDTDEDEDSDSDSSDDSESEEDSDGDEEDN